MKGYCVLMERNSDDIQDMMLLREGDPAIITYCKARAKTPFFMVSDHGGRFVPKKLGDMGVSKEDWERHIAYDIGISGVGRVLHERLRASFIEQNYSRLVIDCNRAPSHPTSIPYMSDGTKIDANKDLSVQERDLRQREIFSPYHEFIKKKLEDFLRERAGEGGCFISLHSFTPEMNGQKRPWDIGLLHDHDGESALIMRHLLEKEGGLIIGDNEPYRLNALNEYTVPYHAASRNIVALEIEIRQDLIMTQEGQEKWGNFLAKILPIYWSIYSKNLF